MYAYFPQKQPVTVYFEVPVSRRVQCLSGGGVWWDSLEQNQHLKMVLKSANLRAMRSEGIWLSRHLLGDPLQQGPQSVDLRESLCRIMRARGSGVMRAFFLYMTETETGI